MILDESRRRCPPPSNAAQQQARFAIGHAVDHPDFAKKPVEVGQARHLNIRDQIPIAIRRVQSLDFGDAAKSLYHLRSEERRVGKEGVSTFRSRWSTYH